MWGVVGFLMTTLPQIYHWVSRERILMKLQVRNIVSSFVTGHSVQWHKHMALMVRAKPVKWMVWHDFWVAIVYQDFSQQLMEMKAIAVCDRWAQCRTQRLKSSLTSPVYTPVTNNTVHHDCLGCRGNKMLSSHQCIMQCLESGEIEVVCITLGNCHVEPQSSEAQLWLVNISSIPSLSLNSLLGTLSFILTLHIHLTILISDYIK